ncbi:MAG: uracil-DNA glycosylase [Thermoguttaceae bacterium]
MWRAAFHAVSGYPRRKPKRSILAVVEETSDALRRMLRAVAQRLESFQGAGVTHARRRAAKPQAAAPALQPPVAAARAAPRAALPVSGPLAVSPAPKPPAAEPAPAPLAAEPACKPPASGSADSNERQARVAALAEVARKVAACTRCAVLVGNRTQTVFGVGDPQARLVFLGEAPGADEDRRGEPFVGRAGQLLTDIIVKGMKLRRQDVYIMNILKCRPPENRTPLPVEAAACREYLEAQLAIIQPRFICCLGACAAQNLLQTDTPIGRLRGRLHDFHGIKVLCTYHPAYVLRNPPAKRQVWDDIQILMAEMGLPR